MRTKNEESNNNNENDEKYFEEIKKKFLRVNFEEIRNCEMKIKYLKEFMN